MLERFLVFVLSVDWRLRSTCLRSSLVALGRPIRVECRSFAGRRSYPLKSSYPRVQLAVARECGQTSSAHVGESATSALHPPAEQPTTRPGWPTSGGRDSTSRESPDRSAASTLELASTQAALACRCGTGGHVARSPLPLRRPDCCPPPLQCRHRRHSIERGIVLSITRVRPFHPSSRASISPTPALPSDRRRRRHPAAAAAASAVASIVHSSSTASPASRRSRLPGLGRSASSARRSTSSALSKPDRGRPSSRLARHRRRLRPIRLDSPIDSY